MPGEIVGTSPNTGEVLVKDDQGNLSWQPGTPEQIQQGTQQFIDYGEAGTPQPKIEASPPPTSPAPPVLVRAPSPSSDITRVSDVEVPKDANMVSRNANGSPEVLATDKERYYAPGSTMYQMGFRTYSEYLKAQEYGVGMGPHEGKLVPEDSFIVEEKGNQYRVTKADLGMGTSTIVRGKLDRGEYYIPITAISERGEKTQVLLRAGAVKDISKLPPEEQFNKLQSMGVISSGAQFVAGKNGAWSFIPEHEVDKVQLAIDKQRNVLKSIEDYRVRGTNSYNLTTALADGISPKMLADAFGEDKVRQAQQDLKDKNDALKTMERFKDGEDYHLNWALATRDPKVDKAAELLFKPEDIAKAEESVYPYKRADKSTVQEKPRGFLANPNEMLPMVGTTIMTTLPGGAIVTAAEVITAAALAWLTGKKVADAMRTTNTYQATTGRPLTIKDLYVIDPKTNKVATLAEVLPSMGLSAADRERMNMPQLAPRSLTESQRSLLGEQEGVRPIGNALRAQIEAPIVTKGRDIPVVMEQIPIVTITPKTKDFPAIRQRAEDFISTSNALAEAEKRTASRVTTIPIDWNKILREGQEANRAAALQRAHEWIARGRERETISPDEAQAYDSSYQDYLRKRAIYREAKKSFVNSTDPQPINNISLNDSMLKSLATYILERQKIGTHILSQGKMATYIRTQGATKPEVRQTTREALRTSTQQATRTATQTEVMTEAKEATQTATKTATKRAIRTTTAVATEAAETPTTAENAAEVENAAEAVMTNTLKIPKIKLPLNATNQQKRDFIKNRVTGAIAYRRGALHDESVWRIRWYPYGPREKTVILGSAPEGAKIATGKGSVIKSAAVLKGIRPAAAIRTNTGAVDDIIIPTAHGITIKSVKDTGGKEIYHRGNITITEKPTDQFSKRQNRKKRTLRITEARELKDKERYY